jgi:hypothetical protein
LVLFVTTVCDFLQNRRDGRWKQTAILAVLAPLAASANPYGFSYWLALKPVASQRFAMISEWLPAWDVSDWTEPIAVAVTLLPVLALGAWVFNPNRRLAQLAWLLMFAAMFLSARRNIWPFVVVCMLVLATNAGSISPAAMWSRLARWLGRHKSNGTPPIPSVLRWAFRAAVLIFLVLHIWPIPSDMPLRQYYTPVKLETGIVQFVKEKRLEGRVFNDYENSSYLQWRFAGQPALYIDGLNAYPDQLMLDYGDIAIGSDRGLQLLNAQGIEIVILTTNRGPGSISLRKLSANLDAKPEWARAYAGPDGIIWVRRVPAYERLWRSPRGPYVKVPFRLLERWGEDSNINRPGVYTDPE